MGRFQKLLKKKLRQLKPTLEIQILMLKWSTLVSKLWKSLKKPCPNLSKKKLPRFLKSPRILMKIGPCWTKQVQTCPILPQPVPNLRPPVGSGCRGGHDLPQVGQQWPRFVWFEPQN